MWDGCWGQVLINGGQRDEGIRILKHSLKIGQEAKFPGTKQIEEILGKLEE